MELQAKKTELAFVKSELVEAAKSIETLTRENEQMANACLGNNHADTLLKIVKQEREDLQKKLQHARDRLEDMEMLKKERTQLIA